MRELVGKDGKTAFDVDEADPVGVHEVAAVAVLRSDVDEEGNVPDAVMGALMPGVEGAGRMTGPGVPGAEGEKGAG